MEDPLRALHGRANAAAVTELDLEPAAAEIGDRGLGRSLLHAQRDVVAPLGQEVATREPMKPVAPVTSTFAKPPETDHE